MFSGFLARIGAAASFIGITIAILMAIFEVQGWKVPTVIALAFIALLLLMIVVALGVIVLEVGKEMARFLERRATSAAWVSSEMPGLLDYEADGLRAIERFTKEMAGLGRDTQKLGQRIRAHTERLQDAAIKHKPKLKQKRANQAAKWIDSSAVYIEKRSVLLGALVKDISRNYAGIIATASIETEEDKQSAQQLIDTLGSNKEITRDTIEKVVSYRDTVRSMHDQNLSRTLRIASKRLAEALDDAIKVLRKQGKESGELSARLAQRLSVTG